MDSVDLTQEMLATGYQIRLPGTFVLKGQVYFSPPRPPTPETWSEFTFFEGALRPCGVSVAANDVTLDLGGFGLSGCSDVTQGLVLVYVAPGVQNFTLRNGALRLCFAGVLVDSFCRATTLRGLSVSSFEQKGIVAYSPQGIAVEDCSVGPNLSEFLYASQETQALLGYGPFVRARDLCAWADFSDDLKVVETSHLVGIDISPDVPRDSPFPPQENTGTGVVLTNVQVLQLTMHLREHSILASVGLRTGEPLFAYGLRGERLPEWYVLRRGAPFREGSGSQYVLPFYPSLTPVPDPWTLTTDYGISVAEDELYEPRRTVWVRGVDRTGTALRGAQGILVAGVAADEVTFADVFVQEPVVKVLSSRVLLPAPKGVEARDLTVTTKASKIVVAPARGSLAQASAPQPSCCAVRASPAQLFASLYQIKTSNFSTRAGHPPGNVPPVYQGSVLGVNAATPVPI
ncbi:MAG: hypothetical protein EBS48_09195 [Actinobacteria bacterium]|jgi:hypothetical protein|nr:hypothetical protein [Actinomycetota bacterium]